MIELALIAAALIMAIILLWKMGTIGFILLILGGVFLLSGGLNKKKA